MKESPAFLFLFAATCASLLSQTSTTATTNNVNHDHHHQQPTDDLQPLTTDSAEVDSASSQSSVPSLHQRRTDHGEALAQSLSVGQHHVEGSPFSSPADHTESPVSKTNSLESAPDTLKTKSRNADTGEAPLVLTAGSETEKGPTSLTTGSDTKKGPTALKASSDSNIGPMALTASSQTENGPSALTAGSKTYNSPTALTIGSPVPRTVTICCLLPFASHWLFSMQRVREAIHLALLKVSEGKDALLPSHITLRATYRDSNCSIDKGMKEAIEAYVNNDVSVFFGPCCDYTAAPVARQVKFWNIPMITSGALAMNFAHKDMYSLLTRVGPNFNTLLRFLLTMLQEFSWRRVLLAFDSFAQSELIERFCHVASSAIHDGLRWVLFVSSGLL
ncbi:hypothetical protein V1264_005332 [Littorina saxatilis]|uniref:Receptor ligand binding region domain-containing protein n=1 Tax=Littorina saxatilis TaxID=31220 RepID=A0AAN9AZK6_9CAEN